MPKPSRIVGLGLIVFTVFIAALIFRISTEPQSPKPNVTSLHQASVFDAEQIQRLVDAGAKLDGLDADGHTPLWLAVRCDKPVAVAQLLKAGADPDVLTLPFGGESEYLIFF